MNEETKRGKAGCFLWTSLILILVLIVLLIVLMKMKKPAPEAARSEQPAPVKIMKIERSRLHDIVYLPAVVEAQFQATLAAEKGGIVVELMADKGDVVKKGQPLLRQDDRSWAMLVDKCELELREAKKALDRFKEMKKGGAVATSDFDTIQTRYEMAEIALRDAQLNMAKCTLKSPADGVIVARFLEPGENAPEGGPAFTLVNTDEIKLALNLPEKDVLSVKPGQEMSFVVDAIPGKTFSGEVTFVSAAASKESNTFPMELRMRNAEGLLKPGMIARVALDRGANENAFALPLTAIIPTMGEYVVFLVENKIAVRHIVKVESIEGTRAVISSGLATGDEVIIEGNRGLSDGMPICVVDNSGNKADTP